jgi:hypothetical protein
MNRVIAGMDWQELYSFASKQALLGLCFDGIERLGEEYPEEMKRNPIRRELLMTWMDKDVVLQMVEPPKNGWVKLRHADGSSGYGQISAFWGL